MEAAEFATKHLLVLEVSLDLFAAPVPIHTQRACPYALVWMNLKRSRDSRIFDLTDFLHLGTMDPRQLPLEAMDKAVFTEVRELSAIRQKLRTCTN